MNLKVINLKIGRKTQLINSSGEFVDGNVTEEDCTSFVNDRYRQMYLKFANKFPEYGQYSEAIDTVAKKSFYAFGDFTEDMLVLNYVGIKYSSSDENYTAIKRREANLLFKENTDTKKFSKTSPYFRVSRDNTKGLGITIMPTPSKSVTDGLYVEYVILPEALSADDMVPNLPDGLQDVVVAYSIADVWETKRDWSNSNQALNRAKDLDMEFFENYQPKSSLGPAKFGIDKSFNPYKR
jgi:hypothetical protein